jgi:sigma-54-interacting transcriptional regulator
LATGKLRALAFGVSADDWHVLQIAHPNVLLIGPDKAVAGFLELLLPLLRPPVTESGGSALVLPAHSDGTLILRDVSQLDDSSQRRLVDWLSDSGNQVQVISTSSSPLYRFVEREVLSASLYYSLNVIMLTLRDPLGPH